MTILARGTELCFGRETVLCWRRGTGLWWGNVELETADHSLMAVVWPFRLGSQPHIACSPTEKAVYFALICLPDNRWQVCHPTIDFAFLCLPQERLFVRTTFLVYFIISCLKYLYTNVMAFNSGFLLIIFNLKVLQKNIKFFVHFVAVWNTCSILRASSSPILTFTFSYGKWGHCMSRPPLIAKKPCILALE